MSKISFKAKAVAVVAVGLVVLGFIGYWVVQFGYNRIYIPEGSSLRLRYKGPPLPIPGLGVRPPAEKGTFAKVDEDGNPLEVGVLEQMRGPGRHFYCPLWWQLDIVKDNIVKAGEVGIVTSKMGASLPKGDFLVDGNLGETEFKGILRKAFSPGVYRVNPYAYDFTVIQEVSVTTGGQTKQAGWVQIPTGYVGVVTNLSANPALKQSAGIQEKVLPPGLYPINPKEKQIDIVEIGYREKSIAANLVLEANGDIQRDVSGEPSIANDDSGIGFPSNDGFTIRMDFTAIWGVMPDQAADIIRRFGNVDAVEDKVVVPQIESICRNEGSRLGAVELLVGQSRQDFQKETSRKFAEILEEKGITVLNGLVRHIHIPQEIRMPIQEANIADELKLTREQEQEKTEIEGDLKEAEAKVFLATEQIKVDTDKLVAEKLAEGNRTAAETAAETIQLVAVIDRQTAELDAQATVLLGEATAGARKMQEEAKAQKFVLAVAAFGSGEAFNQWVFATGLPDDVQLDLLYAGDGTFWTDLKGFSETMLGKQVKESLDTKNRAER